MADKEITAFIVDVGASMGDAYDELGVTHLECGLRYLKDVIASKIIKGRKTDLVSVTTVDCEESNNQAKLKHVSEICEIKQPLFDDLKELDLQPNSKEYEEDEHDGIIRALLLTFQTINTFVGKKKYKKNVVLVTNSITTPELDDEYSDAIVDIATNANINMILIGTNFDSQTKIQDLITNVKVWENLFNRIPGSVLMSGKIANDLIDYPRPKIVRPVKTFTGEFRIGANLLDESFIPRDDMSCVCFDVEGYPATKVDRPPGRKMYGLNNQDEPEHISISNDYEIRLYTDDFDNENEMANADTEELEARPFDVQPVGKEELSKGYKYGNSTVVLPPVLEEKRKYKTLPGLDIRGVVANNALPRCYLTSESVFIVGKKTSESDTRALAGIVDALTDLDLFAIARYVQKPNSEVQMVLLIPVYIKKNGGFHTKRKADDENLEDIRALILTRLPFFKDKKLSSFPPLTEAHTTSGKILKKHERFLPNDEALSAMESYIKSMDMDQPEEETDFEGKKRIFNPLAGDTLLPLPVSLGNHDNLVKLATGIHRNNIVLKDIAIKGASFKGGLKEYVKQEGVIPPLSEKLAKDTAPDPELAAKSKTNLASLAKILNVSYNGKQRRLNKRHVEEIDLKDEEEDDISLEELLSRGAR